MDHPTGLTYGIASSETAPTHRDRTGAGPSLQTGIAAGRSHLPAAQQLREGLTVLTVTGPR